MANNNRRGRPKSTHKLELQRHQNNLQREAQRPQALARQAGVPEQYIDAVRITRRPDGTVSIYFGGFRRPDGPGHGHYAMDANGNVRYKREPYEHRGSGNFTDSEQAILGNTSQQSRHT